MTMAFDARRQQSGGAARDLTLGAISGKILPTLQTGRQVKSESFFDRNPVFSLEQAARAFGQRNRRTTIDRLGYHVSTGRLRAVARGIYAVVPPGGEPGQFRPDAFLVAAAVRPDAIFSHHSAFELLGASHSEWNVVTVATAGRRRPLDLERGRIDFLAHPAALARAGRLELGVRTVDRSGQTLRVTGPERTLVDSFRNPAQAGGVRELVESASGLAVLELELLGRVLSAYGEKGLFAAVGWFLERQQRDLSVPEVFLARLEKRRPRSPHYLLRGERGGRLARRWNLILPEALVRPGEPDER
jgi:predicted transcriptional regulator of viral defense system